MRLSGETREDDVRVHAREPDSRDSHGVWTGWSSSCRQMEQRKQGVAYDLGALTGHCGDPLDQVGERAGVMLDRGPFDLATQRCLEFQCRRPPAEFGQGYVADNQVVTERRG